MPCQPPNERLLQRRVAETDGRQLSIPTRAVTIGNPPYDDPNDIGGYKVAIHEYTHIYQHAHISDEDDGMPNWLEEGSAELLAMFLAGKYNEYINDSVKIARELRENNPGLTIKDLEDDGTSEKRRLERKVASKRAI